MKILLAILGIILILVAVPLGLYIWIYWGGYEGLMMLYNAVANGTGAGDFAGGLLTLYSVMCLDLLLVRLRFPSGHFALLYSIK